MSWAMMESVMVVVVLFELYIVYEDDIAGCCVATAGNEAIAQRRFCHSWNFLRC